MDWLSCPSADSRYHIREQKGTLKTRRRCEGALLSRHPLSRDKCQALSRCSLNISVRAGDHSHSTPCHHADVIHLDDSAWGEDVLAVGISNRREGVNIDASGSVDSKHSGGLCTARKWQARLVQQSSGTIGYLPQHVSITYANNR